MAILLTEARIDEAIPRVKRGLEKYLWIAKQARAQEPFMRDAEFQKRYIGFYRVRRNQAWREAYFSVMNRARREALEFEDVLRLLHAETGRYEASFASKLVATLNPSKPVIDSVVLENLGLKQPPSYASDRFEQLCILYKTLALRLEEILDSESGKYLVSRFTQAYPDAEVTSIKMLDLVLWQIRD